MKRPKHSRVAEAQKLTGGDANASLLLLRLFDWSQGKGVRRLGFEWTVMSRQEWCDDTGLSVDQYNRAIKHLKAKNLVVVEQHMFGNLGHKLAWMRLTPEVIAPLRGNDASSKDATASSGKSAMTHTHKNTDKNTGSNSFGITSTPYSPPNEEVVPGEDGMKVTDVMNKYASSPKKDPSPHSPPSQRQSAAVLGKVWLKALAMLQPGFQPALTQKQLGQLKQIAKQCPPGKAAGWLSNVIENWIDFTLQVKANYGLENTVLTPDIGFVLKYIGEFVKFNLPAPEPNGSQPVVAAPEPVSVQLIATSPKKVTLEELQAILAEDADDT